MNRTPRALAVYGCFGYSIAVTTTQLHKFYLGNLAIWPGLAVLSLQFIPASRNIWLARLPETFIILELSVLLAAVAIYLVFITEVLPFPKRLAEAVLTAVLLPLHTLLLVLITPQTMWESVVISFVMECSVVLVGVAYLVFEQVSRGRWDTFSVVILLGTIGLFLSAAIPLLFVIVEQNWSTYLLTGATALAGSIQVVVHFKTAARPTIPPEPYIALGVAALVILPVVGWWLARYNT